MKIPTLSKRLALTLLFNTLILNSCLSELCNQNDKKVLLQIKKAFNDTLDILRSWTPDTDCCEDWSSVECSADGRVNALSMNNGAILGEGPIPPQIGDLPYLTNLEIHKQPGLTGPIPQELAKLKRLKQITLTWNNLSGPVPSFLGELKALESIELSFNNLVGPIPGSLSTLPSLSSLRLDRNKLTGPIPASFGEFKGDYFVLYLSHNQLSGNVPAALGNKNFLYVDLSRNNLEGDASALFGRNKTTQIVDLSRNLLEFDLSVAVFSKSLQSLDLNHNRIFGNIPVSLATVQYLNVSYNRLCGKIPAGGSLQNFETTAYFHNRCLCGSPLDNCK